MMDDIDIIKKAIETYGIDAQVLMAIEEMSELTKALCKERRTRNSDDLAVRTKVIENITEEVADVQIMLNQIRCIFGINTKNVEQKKIERLAGRLASHEPCPICGPFNEYCSEEFDAYVPVSSEGDIMEREAAPGEEWVYHAKYCPNCGRKLS